MSKSTLEVGKRLVELCKEFKYSQCIDELYSHDIASIEAGSPDPKQSPRTDGIQAIRGKVDWWEKNHIVHGGDVAGPWPHGDRFIVRFTIDVTAKSGPMAGQRFTFDEAALYTVSNGKIIREEFFYSM